MLSQFLMEHFAVDNISDVKPDLVYNNKASAEYVLSNVEKYPNADRVYLTKLVSELTALILLL